MAARRNTFLTSSNGVENINLYGGLDYRRVGLNRLHGQLVATVSKIKLRRNSCAQLLGLFHAIHINLRDVHGIRIGHRGLHINRRSYGAVGARLHDAHAGRCGGGTLAAGWQGSRASSRGAAATGHEHEQQHSERLLENKSMTPEKLQVEHSHPPFGKLARPSAPGEFWSKGACPKNQNVQQKVGAQCREAERATIMRTP